MNGFAYKFVSFFLQTSLAHDVTINGDREYKVPSGNSTIDETLLEEICAISSKNLTSYTVPTISGADHFGDGNATVKDVFDVIVETTR